MELNQNGRFADAVSVSELNEYIKLSLSRLPALADVYVKGEISNFKAHATGHFYFTLKDETSVIRAVMFRSAAAKMKFMPEDGLRVTLHGRIDLFVRDGQYQIYVDSMTPDGVGELYIAFEQIKRRLEAEGLFRESRKRPLPKIPLRIGVITSPTGAAVRDIINVTGRRFPAAEIIVYPALVQGSDAVPSLIAGVEYFSRTRRADVLIIGRGGGSIEELWAFNSEELARVLARCPIPTVSAVGHETDFTVCDFVCDRRAATPSAAAELATPNTADLQYKINNLINREKTVLLRRFSEMRARVERYSSSRVLTMPTAPIDDRRMAVSALGERLIRAESVIGERKRAMMGAAAAKLDALNPLSVLARGYSVVYTDGGRIVGKVADVKSGDRISVCVEDGEISALVE